MRACDRERQSSRTCWTDIRRYAAQSATVQISDVGGLHDTRLHDTGAAITEGTASNGSYLPKKNLKRRKSYFSVGKGRSFSASRLTVGLVHAYRSYIRPNYDFSKFSTTCQVPALIKMAVYVRLVVTWLPLDTA